MIPSPTPVFCGIISVLPCLLACLFVAISQTLVPRTRVSRVGIDCNTRFPSSLLSYFGLGFFRVYSFSPTYSTHTYIPWYIHTYQPPRMHTFLQVLLRVFAIFSQKKNCCVGAVLQSKPPAQTGPLKKTIHHGTGTETKTKNLRKGGGARRKNKQQRNKEPTLGPARGTHTYISVPAVHSVAFWWGINRRGRILVLRSTIEIIIT